MGYKEILIHLDIARGHEARLHLACLLAAQQEAHLVGLFNAEPVPIGGFYSPSTGGYGDIELTQMLQEKQRVATAALASRLEELFRSETLRAGVVGEWRFTEGDTAETVTRQSLCADIAVLGQIDPDNPPLGSAARLPQAVLLDSGRPLLLVPYVGRFTTLGQRILVAWNASREATRAVHDALPILARADTVTILRVNPARGVAEESDAPAEIVRHLARHGIQAEASHTVADDIDIGDLLLSQAADLSSDLIVMGGYGHSRMREFVLGGVSRTLLQHMTVPVLMSH